MGGLRLRKAVAELEQPQRGAGGTETRAGTVPWPRGGYRGPGERVGVRRKRLHATDITSPGTNTPEAGTWFNNSVTRATAKESIS